MLNVLFRSPGGGLVDLEIQESEKKGKQRRRETKIKYILITTLFHYFYYFILYFCKEYFLKRTPRISKMKYKFG